MDDGMGKDYSMLTVPHTIQRQISNKLFALRRNYVIEKQQFLCFVIKQHNYN